LSLVRVRHGTLTRSAKRWLGAEPIIAMSRHESRQKLALEFGATDIVTERGDDGVAKIKQLTEGLGAHSVIEAVGSQEAMMQPSVPPVLVGMLASLAFPTACNCLARNCSTPRFTSTAALPRYAASCPK
jgi:threonine dehydrogenase-like Zn-dependent dehydrogenase